MKKAFTIALLLSMLLLSACSSNEVPQVSSDGTATQRTEATDSRPVDPTMMPENITDAANNSSSQPETEPSAVITPTEPEETRATEKPTEPTCTEPSKDEKEDPALTTEPTIDPVPGTTEPTTPPATEPPYTEPTEPPATEPTESVTEPTDPHPTEEAGCAHEWMCIHHNEEGHWRAGIACDCGWTVYGDPDELAALWNAHSASYPPTESLFYHGGFGSMDEWIVDKPAYDEWVCRHCGEPKP